MPIDEVRHICEKLWKHGTIYYTHDKWNLLDEKDSIADKSNDIFQYFIENKVKYDEVEHQKYLDSLKRK